jgi:thiol-disulfide isomerase/thioredoxin
MSKYLRGLVLLVVSISAGAQTSQPASLSLKDIQGRQLNLNGYRGKVLLINFWATWCIPCRTEIPDLVRLQRQYRNRSLRIIGVTYPPGKISEVRRFARQLKINYPVAIGTRDTKTQFTASETLPFTVVIDREGKVRDVIEGIMYADEFEQKVKPLLSNNVSRTTKESRRSQPLATQRKVIRVDSRGYRPASVNLRRGIPAQLTFIRKTEQTCGTEIVFPDYGINRPLPLNEPVIINLTPQKSGRFKFTCGMNMFRGSLVVR